MSAWIAIGSSAVGMFLLMVWHWIGFLSAVIGVGCVVFGLYRRSRLLLGGALSWFTLAAVIADVAGAPVEIVLLAVGVAVLGWDTGLRAITLGEQLGQAAETTRVEAVHTAASAFVGVVSIGVAYVIYGQLATSYPLVSVLLFCGSVVILLFAQQGFQS
ncbi:DUF7519 family protein [Halomontanus rarus]|uniref:DUF7519 family protein n=1 Tax=Halomontanus rarus TaxID=3034020 RepID=UPI003CE5C158